MSGIIGSYHNIRGSGIVNKLGTDGQVFTSTGVGGTAGFEDAAGGGKIGQVVQAVKTDTYSHSSVSWADITGITVAITPAATSSKILVIVNLSMGGIITSDSQAMVKLLGAGSDIYIGDAASSRERLTTEIQQADNYGQESVNIVYLHSPSTTSETIYKVQMRGTSTHGHYLNRGYADGDSTGDGRGASSITVMEVLA